MKNAVVLAASILLIASAALCQEAGASSGPPTAPPTAHIKGRGCVRPGDVAGCFVVNDRRAHRKYNVFFLGTKPEMDSGITFEGIGYSKLDARCKQGQKVQVSEWKPLAGECPQTRK